MNDSKKLKLKILLGLFILLGFGITIELAKIYYDANYNEYALSSFCSINEFIDCDGVAKSTASQFAGIPLAYWGMFLYLFMGLMLLVDKLKNIKFLKFLEVFKNPIQYIAALGYVSFLVSITLACISIFDLKRICILCFVTYFINLFVALSATDFSKGIKGLIEVFVTSYRDFVDAIKVREYMIAFCVVAFAALSFLTFTGTTYYFIPKVKQQKSIKKFLKMKKNPNKVKGNVLGNPRGNVIIHLYSDFVCPICYADNMMIHKLVTEFTNVRVISHNMPLDKECNYYLQTQVHPNACLMSQYAIAARKQNAYWQMSSELFERQPNDEEAILKIARDLELDVVKLKKDANSKEISQELRQEITDAFSRGISGTPAIIVGGNLYVGIKPYYELKDIVFKHGGVLGKF